MNLRPGYLCVFQNQPSGAGGIQYTILRHEQASGHAFPQVRFQEFQCFLLERLSRNSSLAVVNLLTPNFLHLLLVRGYPNRSTLFVFDVGWKIWTQLLPELLRVARESKLRLRIIHHHDVSHAGGGGATSDHIAINDPNPHALPDALLRASCTHNASSNDNHVVRCYAHRRMPMQNGSRVSRIKSASALTNAPPLMLGYTCPSQSLMLPSNKLPTMLSCFHT